MNRNDQSQSADSLQSWVIDWLSRELKIPPRDLNVQENLLVYGVDSVSAIMLAGDLEDFLGRRLSPTLLWDHPTVASLVGRLQDIAQIDGEQPADGNLYPTADRNEKPAATNPVFDTDSITIDEARQLLDRLDELTDDQVDALLRRLSVGQ